ncbi:MAG: hypothetical protein OIN66_02600 [Candidatus Methanoperedens sp.]|nr:hypothetical protein [Candidatus Methanoperedens sp.]
MRITIKTAILFAAAMLVLAPTAVIVFAQPNIISKEISKERGHVRSFVEPVLIGHGFALNGDQYHILDISAIKMSSWQPGFIRSLLSHNKSREEIVKEITNNTQVSTTAHIRFAGQAYALNITGYDNQSLTGDVLTLPPRGTNQTGFTPSTVGHISLSISKYEGDELSTGTLTMNGTDYKVLLTSPMKIRKW